MKKKEIFKREIEEREKKQLRVEKKLYLREKKEDWEKWSLWEYGSKNK